MFRLRVLEILKAKNKTKYWLWSQMNMSWENFNNMLSNRTQSIKYQNIELLCEILECNIDELFDKEN